MGTSSKPSSNVTLWARGLLMGLCGFIIGVVAPPHLFAQGLVDLSGQVTVTRSGLVLNRSTNTFNSLATVTNSSTSVLTLPLQLVVSSITPAGITLVNPSGLTPSGQPYVNLQTPPNGLAPGQSISNILLAFSDPKRVTFTFATVVVGIDTTPPTITAAVSPLPNGVGWNNGDVTVTFTCMDTLSGIVSCPTPATVTTEGANQLISGTATDGAGNSASTSVIVNLDKTAPMVTITAPQNGAQLTSSPASVTATVSDALSGIASATCNGSPATVSNGSVTCQSVLSTGSNPITVQATDTAGNTGSSTITVELLPPDQPPVANPGGPYTGTAGSAVALDGSSSSDPDHDSLTYSWDFGDGGTGSGVTPNHTYSAAGTFTITLTVDDGRGGMNQAGTTATISPASAGNLPPDPSTVAPPLARNASTTSFLGATQFLYTGTNPIQTGVAPGTITLQQSAVLRGRVLDTAGQPLPGVTLTILNHPEFGQTLSRADGMYDLAVNGGGLLTVQYHKAGYPSAQRQLTVHWQNFDLVPDVILVPFDAHANLIDLSEICDVNMNCTSHPMQVARGGVVTDADGTRQATLFFPSGTSAVMTLADDSAVPLTTLTVRATEYTIGPDGPKAMPADLPPTSGYTYEVEFSVDEGNDAGATRVTFTPALISYTENFLNFPVGTIVPSGEYDRKKGLWLPEPNGLVIKILSITNGQADLDLTGSGQPADATALAALGISTEELQELASLYPVGQTLWRVPIDHFLGLQ